MACGSAGKAGCHRLWGLRIDGIEPDAASVVDASICLVGVGVIMYLSRAA